MSDYYLIHSNILKGKDTFYSSYWVNYIFIEFNHICLPRSVTFSLAALRKGKKFNSNATGVKNIFSQTYLVQAFKFPLINFNSSQSFPLSSSSPPPSLFVLVSSRQPWVCKKTIFLPQGVFVWYAKKTKKGVVYGPDLNKFIELALVYTSTANWTEIKLLKKYLASVILYSLSKPVSYIFSGSL